MEEDPKVYLLHCGKLVTRVANVYEIEMISHGKVCILVQ